MAPCEAYPTSVGLAKAAITLGIETHPLHYVFPAARLKPGLPSTSPPHRFVAMSTVQEIQDAILHLPPQERESLRQWMDGTEEETPEMLAAIDEGLHSLRKNGVTPLEDVRKKIPLWATGSA